MKRSIYRPMRIVHGYFDYKASDSYQEKYQCIYERFEELKEKGYSGVVTNVSFDNYMKDADEWELLKDKIQICKKLGLRMWLYDEDCYPSGAAGTQTLDKNPDFEARALVMVTNILAPGEKITQPLPRGHENLIAAVCYKMADTIPTDEELQHPYTRPAGEPLEFVNDTDQNLLCLAFYQKHIYEGAHAHNNAYAARRYIDISNPEAIHEFIDNTYRRYTEIAGKYYATKIGDDAEDAVIEAIFTDEPSYMGVYINKGISNQQCPTPVHPLDTELPLYPLVNWGKNVLNRFANKYGYRLENELTALFLGHSESFCQVRHDYYQLMSDLCEQAFFAQISDYCADIGLNFSGHILLEDKLPFHVMFEGNYFQLLRHMHIPGIDMLHSTPDRIWGYAFTPLLVRSIAELYDRHHVMDEVSAHSHGGKVTNEEMYISLMLQLAFGANVFTSYYGDEDPDGQIKRILDALERATEAIDGARESETLLLYPIETMMRRRKPLYSSIEDTYLPLIREQDDDGNTYINACEAAMLNAQFTMLDVQKNFTYIDIETILHQPEGKWKTIIVPACDITEELQTALNYLAEHGTQIIWYIPKESQIFAQEAKKLPEGTLSLTTPEELIHVLWPNGALLTGEHTSGIAMAENNSHVLLVNRDTMEKKVCWHGKYKNLVNAMDGKEIPVTIATTGISFTLPGSTALILTKD